MPSILKTWIDDIWIVTGAIWLVAALTAKPANRVQSITSRLAQVAILVFAFVLIFTNDLRFPPLSDRFLPRSPALYYSAVVLTFAGCAFALWARFFLGRNWSGMVTIKKDHELIRTGPYAVVRHPIYAGFLLALLGTMLAIGEIRALLGVVVATIGFRLKSLIEEDFMVQQFGAEYVQYKRRVKALVPLIW